MSLKLCLLLLLGACAYVSGTSRDLATDIPIAQKRLGSCIQEALKFESTYQIIAYADVLIEVSNLFEQIYVNMEALQISEAIIDQIKRVAAEDLEALEIVTSNLLRTTNDVVRSAYSINNSLRSNLLDQIADLYATFSGANVVDFNSAYNSYLQTLSYVGNSVELLILSAIAGMEGPEVSSIYALMQRSNDIINASVEAMGRELVVFDIDWTNAINAVYAVVIQIPTV